MRITSSAEPTISGSLFRIARRFGPYIFGDFVEHALAAGEAPAERFDEAFVAFAPLHLGGRLILVRQRWGHGQPEADEQRQRLSRKARITLKPEKV